MANRKISELPLINTLSGSNSGGTVIPVVVGGTTAQISAENFSKFMNLYAAQTGSANTFTANQTINANLSVTGTTAIGGNTTIGGTLVVAGRLTAEEFHTEITTASVIYSSGSTKFGDDTSDRHEFTGSIYAKDSIIIGTEVLGNAGLNAFSASFSAQLARVQQATASLQQATSSLQAHSASVDAQLLAIQQTTQSLQVATASLQAFSSSVNDQLQRVYQTTQSLHVATASLQAHSASVDAQLLRLQQTTQSLQVATASLQAFSSSVNDQLQRVYQTTQSLHVATASLQFHSASVDSQLLRLQQTTQSLQVATASLQAFTSSVNDQLQRVYQTTQSLHVATASLQAFTASQDGRNFVISQYTSSTDAHIVGISAYTSSNESWKDGVRGEISGIEAWTASLDNTYATDAQLYQLYQATRSLELHSGSMIGITNALMAYTSSNETWKDGVRGEVNGIESYTSSLKAAISVSGTNVQIIGDLNVNKLNVQYVSSSVLVTSGSNIFGDQSIDKHEFTGSVGVTGNLIGSSNIQANKFVFTDGVVATNVGGQNIIGTSGNILYLYTGTSGLYINNSANNAQNVTITDAGVVTTRGGVQIGSSGNDQNLVFGGTNSSIYWGAGGPARMYYSVGDIKISSNGATDVLNIQNIGGISVSGGITGSLMATNGVISGSVQLPEIAGLESYTASLKSAAIVSSSQQIQNYNLFALTASANTFYANQTVNGSITSQISNTDVTFGDVPNIQLINTATSTTNQYAGIRYRFQDGSLNGNSFIGVSRESSTSRGHSIILAPSDNSGGNPIEVIKIKSDGTTQITGSLKKTGTGATAYAYFSGNAGSGGSTSPTYAEGMALSWNNSNGDGESRLTFSNQGGGSSPRFGIWYNDNSVYREVFRAFANSVATSGSFDVGYSLGNDGGARQLTIYGSKSTAQTPVASLNLTQLWNAVSYPVVLEAQQGSLYGNAASDFVLKTSYYSGGINTVQRMRITDSGITQITGSVAVNVGSIKLDSGYGIDFSATSDGSGATTSELLNDYEEGTWTPVIRGDATAGTYELTHNSHYTKVGRMVTVSTAIAMASSITGGGSGYLQITGLPFTKGANTHAIGAVEVTGVDTVGNYLVVKFVTIGATSILFLSEINDNAASSDLPISAISALDGIGFTITYIV